MTATLLSGASALLRTVWQACFLAMPVASATRSPTALRRVCWRARPSRHGSTRLNCGSPRSSATYSPRYPISRESPCATSASTTSNPSPCSGSASTPLGELLLIQSLQITSHAIPDRPANPPAPRPTPPTPPPPAAGRLPQASQRLGSDPLLIQAAGGNSSIKEQDCLWVKASGLWLRDALRRPMFVPVSRVRALVAAGAADPVGPALLHAQTAAGLRPSIETTLHALMPHRVVLH